MVGTLPAAKTGYQCRGWRGAKITIILFEVWCMLQGVIAGVDLGGTKILTGLFDEQGRMLAERLVPTNAAAGLKSVLDRMTSVIEELRQQYAPGHKLLGVAVGAPGPLNSETGVIYEAPNLRWKDITFRELLQAALQVPVWLDNDANLAALGEYTYGYPMEHEVLLYLTVSTGIGGGIIINGMIYRGVDGGAGEFGHMTIMPGGPVCGCGNQGCLEALASGTAIARAAREEVSRGRLMALCDRVKGRIEEIDARLVAELAAGGDPEARRIMEEAIGYLGIGVANLVNLFNPRSIVIGGGLSSYQGLLEQVEEVVKKRAYSSLSRNLRILPAKLGSRAGLMGCLALARLKITGSTAGQF
ncbi:MAG: ROK family protein [Bacillota bacterium]